MVSRMRPRTADSLIRARTTGRTARTENRMAVSRTVRSPSLNLNSKAQYRLPECWR